jgi:hypothetical protein
MPKPREPARKAPKGATSVIRFSTSISRFEGTGWKRLDAARAARADLRSSTEFPADLPVEQLAEAWGDYYRNAVHAFNRSTWLRESDSRERERQAEDERREALARQQHVAGLLQEDGRPPM